MAPSIRNALQDLPLDRVAVVYPGDRRFPLADRVEAVPHISWRRGLSGATGDVLNPGLGNVGHPAAAPGARPTTSFATMLETHRRGQPR